MNKKMMIFFSFLACISVIYSGFVAYGILGDSQRQKTEENIKNKSAKIAKDIVDEIYDSVRANYERKNLTKYQIYDFVKSKINEINLNNYKVKAYAFNELGFYIVHYSKDYEGLNAFLERDTDNKKYIKELANNKSENGICTKATILWTNNSIRHLLTFIRKDPLLNIYYGCTIDLDDDLTQKHIFNEKEYEITKRSILVSTIVSIFLIVVFWYAKRKEFI